MTSEPGVHTVTEDDVNLAALVAETQDQDDYPTFLGVPLNRVLTIGRAPINFVAGTLASWLLVHVHIFGLFHLQQDGLSTGIAQGLIWLVTAVLTDRGIAQWVKGHHIDMATQAQVLSAVLAPAASPAQLPPGTIVGGGVPHPDGEYDAERDKVEPKS